MTRALHWPGLLASAVLLAATTACAMWAILATPGRTSSHLTLVDRAEDAASSGTPRAQAWSPSEGGQEVWVKAEPGREGSGRGRVYRWEAWGKEWAVQVWPDTGFLAPTMLIRHEAPNHATVTPPTFHARCFHTGVLLGATDSAVAVNTCNGLSGVIRVAGLVYLIEPIHDSEEESDRGDSDPMGENSDHPESEVDSDDSLENIVSEDDYSLFENGTRPHTFTRTAVPEVLVRGQRSHSHSEHSDVDDQGRSSPHRQRRRLHVCDTTGSGYIDSIKGGPRTPPRRRTRRFLYSHRYSIEVMVVVDNKMSLYHGKHVNQYVLTLMSVVALIFRDVSIGNRIDIAVVEVMRQDRQFFISKRNHENSAEVPGKSAEEMLKMFCKWQQMGLKHNTNHPRRYDTALLLTRENICRNPWTKSCDTLGLAELGTMCSRHSSCAIVQDNGLSAAFTIAHELGHLLNMPHDNDEKCSLLQGNENSSQRMNVMSRMLDHNTLPWEWSNCSRHYLTEFLQGGHGQCLEDEPWTNKLIEETTEFTLAGELFNASKQCQYVFGMNSRICPYMPTCKRLWCTTSLDEKEGCRTQHMPWADGTTCNPGSWCLRGKCVPKDKTIMKKVHGNWGEWLEWSACSRTCGVGVRSSARLCNSPKPLYGGQYCIGERMRYESCIMKACPPNAIDFRTQQCQVYNNKNFGLSDIPEDVIWIPKYAGISREDSCQLFCQVYNKTRTSYFKLRDKVEDGTPCGPGTYDICVSGKCHMAGCDYVLNSTAKADNCGVCNGDNSTCEVTSGSVEKSRPYGYSDIIVIPEGAAMIDITQQAYHDQSTDDNYLALVDLESGKYLLNGGSIVTPFPKLVAFGGTLLEYSGSSSVTERINSTKPLQKKLLVQILSVGDLNPPFIVYSYTKSNLHSDPTYYWKLGDWTNCSELCVGKRERTAVCLQADTGMEVKEELCSSYHRPATLQESCVHTCPVAWDYSDWSKCRVKEEQCVRQRELVGCVSSLGNTVEEEHCAADKIHTQEECSREECPSWSYSEWSPCSCQEGVTEGVQQRPYSCQLRGRPLPSWECEQLDKPLHLRNCSCWYAEEWNSWCDLEGHDSTAAKGGSLQRERKTSAGQNSVNRGEGVEGGKTSLLKCGTGVMRRHVHCGSPADNLPLTDCDALSKPSETAPCHVPCPSTTTTTTSTTTTTTSPPTSVSIKTSTTSSTLTVASSSSVTSSPTDNSSPLFKSKNSKHRSQHSSFDPHFRKHKSEGGVNKDGLSSWRKQHHHADSQRVPYIKGIKVGIGHDRETNEIPNVLPSSLDERERSNPDDFTDNQLDIRHHNGYRRERNKDPHHQHTHNTHQEGQHHSSEDENNSVMQEFDYNHITNWQTGGWSTCSQDCGGGEKRRQVVCITPEAPCPPEQRPPDTAPCNTHVCPEWSTGDWGHCRLRRGRHRRCGRGHQERLVVCREPSGLKLDEQQCHADDKPTHTRVCKIPCRRGRQRQRYKWKAGDWSPCSKECDRGVMYRNVTCIDTRMNGMDVHNEYCLREGLHRRKASRGCNKHPCPFRWVASPWSECSEVCGPGAETREVTCHSVNHHGWVDPQPVTRGCDEAKRPRNIRKCNLGHCQRRYYWRIKPWKPCQAVCNKRGRQRRGIICVNAENQRVQRHLCSREHRPRKKQRCQAQPCGHISCSQAQNSLHVTVDGEYSLLVGGQNMSIFCSGMNTSNPQEYLTLPAGEEGNFAEMYNKILIHPDTCPHDGERRSDCNCIQDESSHSGYTAFSKVRLNTSSLVIDTYDFTFARAVDGNFVRYGEAGDCFSMAMCPQGAFSINLAGTALAVSPRTDWITRGNKAAHYINRLDDNQRILGRCGGYCGTCAPDPITGLKLSLRDG
ncbi:A disintegrin and metalloproteinase with thrombospondin motifs 9 [Panulirus ornatus]|uniref:A disintegrin and metalloproteinase with thrombospondin motifs 9 n=1 Tax=Panulirus ornatus TaxID=150431 RepID=UPI003A87008A